MIHSAIGGVLLVLPHIICFAAMTERKYSIRKTALIYGAYSIFFIALMLAVFMVFGKGTANTAMISFSGTILVGFYVFVQTSSDAFCKKLFLFICYANLFCIFICLSLLIPSGLIDQLSEAATEYVRNGVRALLYLPTVLVYLKLLRPYVRAVPGTKKRTWYSISLVVTLFLAVFTYFIVLFYTGDGSQGAAMLLFGAMVLIYCAVLWVIFGTIWYMNYETKTELVGKNLEYLQGQLALAKESELTAKTIRHDAHHHNQNMAALLQKGDMEEALRYIRQYDESLEAAKPREFCPHATVNAILSSFYSRAQKEGISVSVSADTPRESAISDMDFVAVLSNLLENALNGCKAWGPCGKIRVDIRTVSGKTVIVCSNYCTPELVLENDMPQNRGTGIDSILRAVRKYKGDIRYELDGAQLTVCVILSA